jgi:hypothetical protein
MKREFLVCQCFSPEHTLQFMYDEDDKTLYSEIHLSQYRSFFKRVLVAIKYIFGYKCQYGHWDTFHMQPEDLSKIIKIHNDICGKI